MRWCRHMVCLPPTRCPGSQREEGDQGVSRRWGDRWGDEMPAQNPKRRLTLPSWDWSQGSKERRLTRAPSQPWLPDSSMRWPPTGVCKASLWPGLVPCIPPPLPLSTPPASTRLGTTASSGATKDDQITQRMQATSLPPVRASGSARGGQRTLPNPRAQRPPLSGAQGDLSSFTATETGGGPKGVRGHGDLSRSGSAEITRAHQISAPAGRRDLPRVGTGGELVPERGPCRTARGLSPGRRPPPPFPARSPAPPLSRATRTARLSPL